MFKLAKTALMDMNQNNLSIDCILLVVIKLLFMLTFIYHLRK